MAAPCQDRRGGYPFKVPIGARMTFPHRSVKAAHEDRTFIVFGPQVIVEESGPRILTPDAMDVTAS